MSISLSFCSLRALSTRVPRPKDWKVSPFDAPQPVVGPAPPRLPTKRKPVATEFPNARHPPPRTKTPEKYVRHREALKRSFPDGWAPNLKLTRDAIMSLRMLHHHSKETFTTPILAERFRISPEAVRKILRSKWQPSSERLQEMRVKEELKKKERRRARVEKEWGEGVDKGVLKEKPVELEAGLELT